MFIVTFTACNNDTYESSEMTLRHCINSKKEQDELNEDELQYDMFFKKLPSRKQIKEMVKSAYDGVWEPDLKSIRAFQVIEIDIE